jgi:3-mercaptopyruvate sulfurtransferase SseA
MKLIFQVMLFCVAPVLLLLALPPKRMAPQEAKKPQAAVDPQTGRAMGAKEMTPDDLHKLIEQKAKLIIIDVRDESEYQQETIKGAIHIPLEILPGRLKEIPKDTVLVFT